MVLIMQNHTQRLKQFSRAKFCKKSIQVFMLIFVFFFLLYFIHLPSYLYEYFNRSISRSSKNLSNKTTKRNYIFLVCNVILLFLIKSSGLVRNPSPSTHVNGNSMEKKNESPKSIPKFSETEAAETIEVAAEVEKQKNMQNANMIASEGCDQKPQDEDEKDDQLLDIEEENGLLSREELNKKCDEFIRKIKEGIKLDNSHAF